EGLRNKLIIAFMFATGVRVGELLAIDVSQIDTEKRSAFVKTFKRVNYYRTVFWDPETNELMKRWLDVRSRLLAGMGSSDALFVSLAPQSLGKRLHKSAVQRIFRATRRKLDF